MSNQPIIEGTGEKSKGAWLVTWEYAGDWEWARKQGFVDRKVAAILNYRRSSSTVKLIVEIIYRSRCALFEQLRFAKHNDKNPYQVTWGTLGGVPYDGRMTCGHNPYLHARRVRDLESFILEDGSEHLRWNEEKIELISPGKVKTEYLPREIVEYPAA